MDFYKIKNVKIVITSMELVLAEIEMAVRNGLNIYICVSNMRTVVLGNKDKKYFEVMNNSYMNIPDGMPLIWCAKAWGIKNAHKTSGPNVFIEMLCNKKLQLKHFFLGDTEETLKALKLKCEKEFGSNIVGTYSPPFLPVEEFDFEGIAKMINVSKADIVWVSMRAPKQDFLANRLQPLLDAKVVIGVGAAFRFVLGEYKQPPVLIQRMGLAGLFCLRNTTLLKELKWYIKHTFYLLGYVIQILFFRWKGKKYYE